MERKEFNQKHPRVTRSLKDFILNYEESLEPEIYFKFLDSLDLALKNAYAEITSLPSGIERARKLHQLVEKEISSETEIKISCFKGCSACCHFEVEITNYEAEILAELVETVRPIDRDILKLQSRRPLQGQEWKSGIHRADNRCVFLGDDKACSIYEHRPVMCRRHSVTTPPVNCATQNEEIGLRFFPRVDLLISAANEDPSLRIGPMAKFLAKLLQD